MPTRLGWHLRRLYGLATNAPPEPRYVPPFPTKTGGCVSVDGRPDPACTSGGTRAVRLADLCVAGASAKARDVTHATKVAVYAMYGMTPLPGTACEIDHLIPLCLSGSNHTSNLWPQLAAPRPGFHEKDFAEAAAHRAVCRGEMKLAGAQRQMAEDWHVLYDHFRRRAGYGDLWEAAYCETGCA